MVGPNYSATWNNTKLVHSPSILAVRNVIAVRF